MGHNNRTSKTIDMAKGKVVKKVIEGITFKVGSEETLFHHPKNEKEERDAFEKYLFTHLQPYWQTLPKEVAVIHRAYVREYLSIYCSKVKKYIPKGGKSRLGAR